MKRKILVVDDNKMNSKMLSDILKNEGYEVFTLFDGINIVETVLLIKPDAILLDIVMPKVDGFEVCKTLKKIEDTQSIPIIMITSLTETDLLRKAFEYGAFDYIKKPFDQIEVIARLQSAIRFSDQQKKLESLAMRDGLTNLYNHRMVMELLYKEYSKSIRNKSPIAFIMFDIDHFKKVNDTFGHKGGDFVIKNLADLIMKSVRESDIVGRYGGEEFCITISNESFDDVIQLLERVREKIETFDFFDGNSHMNITASIGLAYKESSSKLKYNDLINIADKMLYSAKSKGRNKTEYQILI